MKTGFAALAAILFFVTADVGQTDEVPMKPPLQRVLVVCDQTDEWTAKFVHYALAPPGQGKETRQQGHSGIDVTLAKSSEIAELRLSKFLSIFLVDVAKLDSDALAAIKARVQDGGGLCLFVGQSADTDFYRAQFDELGHGLLPVAIGNVAEIEGGNPRAAIELAAKDHQVFRVFDGQIRLDAIEVNRYRTIDKRLKAVGSSVIFRSRNGDPLVCEHRLGKGRVITFLTAPDREWTNWMTAPAWVITLLLTHEYLAGEKRQTDEEVDDGG